MNQSEPEIIEPPTTRPPVQISETLTKPIVSYVIIGITVLVYLLQVGTNWYFGVDVPGALGMKINAAITDGAYWRLFTPVLLHGSIFHIVFNMYALIVIGLELEKRFGHLRFGLLYLSGAFAGNVVSYLFSANPSLGASTAIFGLLGAELIFFYRNREIFGQNARRALQNVITIAAINFIIGLSPGIDNWGHLGGFLGGLLFTWFSGPLLGFEGIYPMIRVIDKREKIQYGLGFAIVFLLFWFFVIIKNS